MACSPFSKHLLANESVHQVPTQDDTFGLLKEGKKIPVIFDTDIGSDIDDTWALLYLLKCPELDVRLVSTDGGIGPYRARLAAKFLTACGRDDLPVSVCKGAAESLGNQQDWMRDYDLDSYRGEILKDSSDAIIQTIHASEDPVTVICVGPVPAVAEAIRRDPTICKNARFVGMHGAIHVGYGGKAPPVAESNVKVDPTALQGVFAADWQCSITPLDTCGILDLSGERYAKIHQSKAIGIEALMENYRDWLTRVPWLKVKPDPAIRSTTLLDLVAIYMAFSETLLEMQTLPLEVTSKGMTVIEPSAREVRCAMKWTDLGAFKDHLSERLTSET